MSDGGTGKPRTSAAVVALLAVIAVAVVAIAVVLILKIAAKPWQEDAARRGAREGFISEAQIYCTLGGVVPGMTGLTDPRYTACVVAEVKSKLEAWDQAHSSDAPPDGKGYDHLS